MSILRVDVDGETFDSLLKRALSERRPLLLQAAVELRRACGLQFPFPYTTHAERTRPSADEVPNASDGGSEGNDAA
jgi:hypothetical protein